MVVVQRFREIRVVAQRCDKLAMSENRIHVVWVDKVVHGLFFSWVEIFSINNGV